VVCVEVLFRSINMLLCCLEPRVSEEMFLYHVEGVLFSILPVV
jgi:hypothetical protein